MYAGLQELRLGGAVLSKPRRAPQLPSPPPPPQPTHPRRPPSPAPSPSCRLRARDSRSRVGGARRASHAVRFGASADRTRLGVAAARGRCRQGSLGSVGRSVRLPGGGAGTIRCGCPPSLGLIGEGRSERRRRRALPTTAFLEKFSLRPISAVARPSAQSCVSLAIFASVHGVSLSIDFSRLGTLPTEPLSAVPAGTRSILNARYQEHPCKLLGRCCTLATQPRGKTLDGLLCAWFCRNWRQRPWLARAGLAMAPPPTGLGRRACGASKDARQRRRQSDPNGTPSAGFPAAHAAGAFANSAQGYRRFRCRRCGKPFNERWRPARRSRKGLELLGLGIRIG